MKMMGLTLLIPEKADVERDSITAAWEREDGVVARIGRFGNPPAAKYPDSTLVGLAIGFKETSPQSQVKAVGGRWDKDKKLWIVPYGCIRGTQLEKLIVLETKQ